MKQQWDSTSPCKSEGYTLILVTGKTFLKQVSKLIFFLLLVVVLWVLTPYITAANIDYIAKHAGQINYGLLLFGLTVLNSFVHKTIFCHMVYQFDSLSTNITNVLKMMIYCKSLRFNSLANKQFSESQIINYLQTDAGRFGAIGYFLSAFFYGPIQIVAGVVMMYGFVGMSFLAAVGVMLLLAIFSYFNGKTQRKINDKVLKAKDERVKVTKEMLDIIRFIKISVIEKFFFKKIDEKRAIELGLYIRRGVVVIIQSVAYRLSVPLMLSFTFMLYVHLGSEISSQVAFSVMMAAQVIEHPVNSLPDAITQLMQIMVSIKRIEKFLMAEELDPNQCKNGEK